VEFTAPDLEAFKTHAQTLAREIYPPLLVLVSGNLGAGKTTFIAEVLRVWGINSANSPTFNLRNDYNTEAAHVIHLDFYRLKPSDSALDLLPPDEDYSETVVFAEWPEKVHPQLFQPFSRRAHLTIDMAGNRRILKFLVAPAALDEPPAVRPSSVTENGGEDATRFGSRVEP
jgi:tRNA threonylcarbamoyladenosine biosynthesis protein TsaE